ncbi:MAG: RNA polymerase sigma factor [Blastocatellia bacterium]|nr:RNA polymerase sigma factor [Blastocatellia bacterium]
MNQALHTDVNITITDNQLETVLETLELDEEPEADMVAEPQAATFKIPEFEDETEAAPTTAAPETLDELYRLHYRRVYSLCLRMTSNTADAEDLAHDVFIQLHRKLSSFRGESAFTTWLHRITVNQVLMHFRKKSYRSETVTDDGEMPDVVVPSSRKPSSMPIIDRIALLAAVEQLPRGYRTVFIMHDLQGYEHEEIGQILKVSAGTSKSQLHKARMRLRTLLLQRAGETAENMVGTESGLEAAA